MKTKVKRILTLAPAILVLGVGTLVLYYVFFLHLVRVPTGAMANTIIPGDCLIVKKRAFGEINRSDLIVFSYPKDLSTKYISRVIGLPRETIEVRGKLVYINNIELPEQRVTVKPNFEGDILEELSTEGTGPYRVFYTLLEEGNGPVGSSGLDGGDFGSNGPLQIPDNEYYVMGDNRDNSEDSRYKGTVPRSLIFGKPTMIYWSSGQDKVDKENVRSERIFTKIGNN